MQQLQPNTTLQGGKYRIERVLGQGGFGNTYVGYNTEFEETVAIKEFFMKGVTERDESTSVVSVSNADNVLQFEEQREKFKKEARRLRKLKNEHIVKVHDLFEENGTAYYVMDFIGGESLAEKIKKKGQPFTETEVKSILSQILEALKEVHQNEIWHLDLKPGNIMLDKNGMAYLIDFGASKQIRANGSMTTSTALCYTPGYAPNEQIGQMYDRFGPWTDIYALGATVYNLLTYKKPPMAIDIEEDEEEAFDFPASVSEDMRKLVVWMMQPKRKARPQSVEEILCQINELSQVPKYSIKGGNDQENTIVENSYKSEIVDESTFLAEKTISIGNFVYADGNYSERMLDKEVLGVVLSKDSDLRMTIISPNNEDHIYNGSKIEWRIATIKVWIEILEKLGKTKVEIGLGKYKSIKDNVCNELEKYGINELTYYTRDDDDSVPYTVKLDDCYFDPYSNTLGLPKIYVTEIELACNS